MSSTRCDGAPVAAAFPAAPAYFAAASSVFYRAASGSNETVCRCIGPAFARRIAAALNRMAGIPTEALVPVEGQSSP